MTPSLCEETRRLPDGEKASPFTLWSLSLPEVDDDDDDDDEVERVVLLLSLFSGAATGKNTLEMPKLCTPRGVKLPGGNARADEEEEAEDDDDDDSTTIDEEDEELIFRE
jgi:hypothetical protein